MTTNTFHPFPRLPPELRAAILNSAVRPTGSPGVHYFSLFPKYKVQSRHAYRLVLGRRCQTQVLRAPLPADKSSSPWNKDESTYAIDGGLWDACRESHLAMRRRYRRQRKAESRRHTQEHAQEHLESSATFAVDDGKQRQYFTVLPLQDLFFIEPHATGPKFEILPAHMPFSAYQNRKSSIRHFAMMFNPSWRSSELVTYYMQWLGVAGRELKDEHVEVYSDLLEVVRSRYSDYARVDFSDTTVWLVDYRLRRKSTVFNENDRELEVFRDNNCTYYAMPMGHESEHCAYDEEARRDRSFEPVWEFISTLQYIGTWHEAEESGIPAAQVELKRLRLLVCEKDY